MGMDVAVLLDGMGGALLGAFVTAGAVWTTLRHEKRRSDADRREADATASAARAAEAEAAAVEAATVALGRLQGACLAFGMTASRPRIWFWEEHRIRTQMVETASALADARARVLHRWPGTGRALAQCGEELASAVERQQREVPDAVRAACTSTVAACRSWLDADPLNPK